MKEVYHDYYLIQLLLYVASYMPYNNICYINVIEILAGRYRFKIINTPNRYF